MDFEKSVLVLVAGLFVCYFRINDYFSYQKNGFYKTKTHGLLRGQKKDEGDSLFDMQRIERLFLISKDG